MGPEGTWPHPAALTLLQPHRQNQSVSELQACASWLTPVAGVCWSPCDLMNEDRTFPDMGHAQPSCPKDGQAPQSSPAVLVHFLSKCQPALGRLSSPQGHVSGIPNLPGAEQVQGRCSDGDFS